MTISIDLKDANKDGKGINFDAYMKAFNKSFEADGRGGFNNGYWDGPIMQNGSSMVGDDYVAWDGVKKGQSVIFEGTHEGSWEYEWEHHTVEGALNGVAFGVNTKEKVVGKDDGEDIYNYTNNGEIHVTFDAFTTTFGNTDFVNSLTDGNTKKFLQFLNSDSIEFTGSSGRDTFTSFSKADILHGEGGRDVLNGGGGRDTIYGDEGADTLKGNAGADTFVFEAGDGKDKILDFGRGADVIDFSGQFADFDAVLAAATKTKGGVSIAYDGGSVLLSGWKIGDLSEAHFHFDV